jgi:hypothetical protein
VRKTLSLVVLVPVAVLAVALGSFFAGRHYERSHPGDLTFGKARVTQETSVIPAGKDGWEQSDNISAFCKTHPNAAFLSGSEHGVCTADGQNPDIAVWKVR